MRWPIAWAVGLLALAAACESGGGGDSGTGETPRPTASAGTSHALGAEEAPVVLVDYADFQ